MAEEQKENGKGSEEKQESPRRLGIPDELMDMVGASPPKFVNFDQLMSAADGMKNMSLAHEIAVNNDFEISEDQSPENSLQKRVRDTMHRAFWDVFQEKLSQDPPDMSMALNVIGELKEMLNDIMLPQQEPLRDQINQVLDMELIKQKMEHDAFDIDYYSGYVIDTMARLCAPVRDQSIAHIRTITDIVPKFRAIMETLDLMKRDMVNFTIKQIRPYIQQHSIDYERKKFAQYYETQTALGLDPLNYTQTWLKRSYDKLMQAACEAQSEGASGSSTCIPTPANVMTEAYLEILNWSDPNNFPETMLLDQGRFMSLRDKLQSLAIMTSVQLVTFGVVGAAVDGVEALKTTMKDHVDILLAEVAHEGIKTSLQAIGVQMVKDVEESLSSRGLPALTDTQKHGVLTQIAGLGTRDSTVRQLMFQRLGEFIREGMSGKPVTNLRVPKGCTAVHKELCQVLGNFLRLSSHNRSVFGPHYAPIIQGLIKPPQEGGEVGDGEKSQGDEADNDAAPSLPTENRDLPNGHC